jgi:hypothetical protein
MNRYTHKVVTSFTQPDGSENVGHLVFATSIREARSQLLCWKKSAELCPSLVPAPAPNKTTVVFNVKGSNLQAKAWIELA